MGVGVALDDFGTGYSSLGYLTTMSFSKLKIDRSFTRDIATDERARKLLISVARLSRDLDMTVTVEGVETEAQLQVILEDTDIEHAQGFLFGPPLPARDIAELIIKRMTRAGGRRRRDDRSVRANSERDLIATGPVQPAHTAELK